MEEVVRVQSKRLDTSDYLLPNNSCSFITLNTKHLLGKCILNVCFCKTVDSSMLRFQEVHAKIRNKNRTALFGILLSRK